MCIRDRIIIPLVKEENLIAAVNRREKYSIKRDVQAAEFNTAIANRLAKDAVKQESNHDDDTPLD